MNTGVPSQDFPGSDLGMAVQVVQNRHGQENMHPMGAGFTLVFVKLAPFGSVPHILKFWQGFFDMIEPMLVGGKSL